MGIARSTPQKTRGPRYARCLRYWSRLGTLRAPVVEPGLPAELTATSRCFPGIAPLPSVFRAGTAALRGPHPVTAYSRLPAARCIASQAGERAGYRAACVGCDYRRLTWSLASSS